VHPHTRTCTNAHASTHTHTHTHTQGFPNSSEPYHTLGLLHEAMGNSRKALDFYMIAAHLTSKVCVCVGGGLYHAVAT